MCWYTVFCPPSLQARIQLFSFLFISGHKEHQHPLPCTLPTLLSSLSVCVSRLHVLHPAHTSIVSLFACLAPASPICRLTPVSGCFFPVPSFFSTSVLILLRLPPHYTLHPPSPVPRPALVPRGCPPVLCKTSLSGLRFIGGHFICPRMRPSCFVSEQEYCVRRLSFFNEDWLYLAFMMPVKFRWGFFFFYNNEEKVHVFSLQQGL